MEGNNQMGPVLVQEPWVDAGSVAAHIGFTAVKVRSMAREGLLPATAMKNGARTYWRFKLSLVDAHMRSGTSVASSIADMLDAGVISCDDALVALKKGLKKAVNQ